MTDWYVEITEWAPDIFKTEKYLQTIIDSSTPFMNHFCSRLSQLTNWKLEEANKIFKEIADEFPVMTAETSNGEFRIRYNKWVYIKLTESPKEIYRESKIKQILA